MSLTDDLGAIDDDIQRARADALADEVGRLRKVIAGQQSTIDRLELLTAYSGRALRVPKWLTRKPKKHTHQAIVCANLSDTHFDEVVNPSELSGQNAYNRDIGRLRLEKFFTGVVNVASNYWSGVTYSGMTLFLSGDIFSGMIHDLDATNDGDGPLDSLDYWTGHLASGIGFLADEIGAVHVPCVVGNHSRLDIKPRSKNYVRRNFEWKLYQDLARYFDKDERVTFQITDDTEQQVQVFDRTFLQYHGMTGGGGGIGGIWPPLMRLIAKLHNRWGSLGGFDAMVCGHWHQHVYAPEQGLLANGSLIGLNEWARSMQFRPERPQQMLWLVTPEHGCTSNSPVFVQDRKKEGW